MTNILAISFIQKRIAVGVMAIAMFFGMFAFAVPAHAQFATPSQTSAQTNMVKMQALIQSLLKQVAALEAQLKARQSGLTGSTLSQITRNLGVGNSGTQVRVLQQCLRDQGFFKANVSGTYGATTRDAVKAFQAAKGIVSSGTAWSTGYGYVGPKTRRAINNACVSAVTPARPGGTSSSAKLTASPRSGEAPLAVTFKSTHGDSKTSRVPDAGRTVIDFGDGSDPVQVTCDLASTSVVPPSPSPFGAAISGSSLIPNRINGLCKTAEKITHKYKKEGTYKAKLMRVGMFTPTPETSSQVLDTVKVVVGETADDDDTDTDDDREIGDVTYDVDGYDVSVTYTAQICSATRTIDWGDGDGEGLAIDPSFDTDCSDESLTTTLTTRHTYAAAGEYTVELGFGTTNWAKKITITGNEGDEDNDTSDDQSTDPSVTEIYAKVNFTQTSRSNSNPHGKRISLPTGKRYADNEWFPLTKNGQFINDDAKEFDAATFAGLSVTRNGDGTLRITHVGDNEKGYEMAEGKVVIKNGMIKKSSLEKIKFEDQQKTADQFDTLYDLDYARKTSDTRITFGTYVTTGRDAFEFVVEPAGDVLGVSTESEARELATALVELDATLSTLEAMVDPAPVVLGAATHSEARELATELVSLDMKISELEAMVDPAPVVLGAATSSDDREFVASLLALDSALAILESTI